MVSYGGVADSNIVREHLLSSQSNIADKCVPIALQAWFPGNYARLSSPVQAINMLDYYVFLLNQLPSLAFSSATIPTFVASSALVGGPCKHNRCAVHLVKHEVDLTRACAVFKSLNFACKLAVSYVLQNWLCCVRRYKMAASHSLAWQLSAFPFTAQLQRILHPAQVLCQS